MAKRKNQSFVKINENKKINEEILDPLKQYEYIEPKKKLPIKTILLFIFTIILIILILVLAKIISKEIKKEKQNIQNIQNTTTTKNNFTMNDTTTTTTTTTSSTTKIEQITETLTCSRVKENNGILFTEIIITEYYNKKLRNDITSINVKLTDKQQQEEYNNQIYMLKLTMSKIINKDNKTVSYNDNEEQFEMTVKTEHKKDEMYSNLFLYDESLDLIYKDMIVLGYECK